MKFENIAAGFGIVIIVFGAAAFLYTKFIKDDVSKAQWQVEYLEDKFGDKTNYKYIKFETEGTFSNSAEVDAFLGVKLIVGADPYAGILLYEYNYNSPPINFIGYGDIDLKNSKNETMELITFEWSPAIGLTIYDNYFFALVNFLKKSNGEVKVFISDRYTSRYAFKIDVTGFLEAYTKLKDQSP